MRKIILIFIATATVLIGAVWLAINQRAEAPSEQPQPTSNQTQELENNSTATITYYEDRGFEPSEITINQGQTVTFKVPSDAEIPVWVASDPHPEHTDYPEFDAARILDALPSPGEGYSFVFDRVGVWEFHNHTFPDHTGVINVIE